MSAEEIFKQRMRLSRLFAMYGGLLTEKQFQCLSFYFDDDLSLSEIADEVGVSRQAVHDLLKRVEQTLERYEAKLKLFEQTRAQEAKLLQVRDLLKDCQAAECQQAVKILSDMCTTR